MNENVQRDMYVAKIPKEKIDDDIPCLCRINVVSRKISDWLFLTFFPVFFFSLHENQALLILFSIHKPGVTLTFYL